MKIIQQMRAAATIIIALVFSTIFISGMAVDSANAMDDKPTEPQRTTGGQESVPTYVSDTAEPMEDVEHTPPIEDEPKKEYVYYDVPLDDSFQEYIQDVCERYGFDRYDVVIALIERESSFRENVISPTDDYGYMQINEINHEWLGEELGITDFLDGEQNVLAGVYILSDLYDRYDDIGLALMCYNCGENGAKNLWEQGIYSTAYSRGIMELTNELEMRT